VHHAPPHNPPRKPREGFPLSTRSEGQRAFTSAARVRVTLGDRWGGAFEA
jgi:hypothetical protein